MFLRSMTLNKDYPLADGFLLIGRREKRCQIVLEPDSVSKEHLELRIDGDTVLVRDESSRNNTRLNHRLIRGEGWIKLQPNDVIDICGFDFQLLRDGVPGVDSGSCIVDTADSDSSSVGSRAIPLSKQQLDGSQQFSQLRALLAITSTLRDVLHMEDVLRQAVNMLFQIFPAVDRAAICLIEEDQGITPRWWQLRDGDRDRVIRISQAIARHVAETSEAVITDDAMDEFEGALSVHALAIRSVMCVPLIDADEQVFGLIHVDAGRPNMFEQLDLEVLAAVAVQISLAIGFSRLHASAVEDAVLRKDVEKAREVQQRYLPAAPPAMTGYDLAGYYRAARHVGGDYIDYVPLEDGRLAIVLGDVVGKGVPAALTMVRLATETRAGLEVCDSPQQLVRRLNQRFADDFITLVVLMLDPVASTITISNAGHEPPLLRDSDGSVTPIGFDASGCPLSVLEDEEYEETTIDLLPGQSLVIYTDGFPDAEHEPSDRRFGSDRIAQMLSEFQGTAGGFIAHAVDQVDRFVDGGAQFDDMCMVCLRRNE